MTIIRTLTDSQKRRVAGRQRFRCAGSIDVNCIPGYTCPLSSSMNGNFDEAFWEIDHIQELRENGTDDLSNLQALCPSCHKVKTGRTTTRLSKQTLTAPVEGESEEEEEEEEETPRAKKTLLIFKDLQPIIQDSTSIYAYDGNTNTILGEGKILLELNKILYENEHCSANGFITKFGKKNVWRDLRILKDGVYTRLLHLK